MGVTSKRYCRCTYNHSTSASSALLVGAQAWITVILNGLPWKPVILNDIKWFALETNRDHSVVFETASKYCISDSFVDHDGYSISPKGFLPTVIDIIVI